MPRQVAWRLVFGAWAWVLAWDRRGKLFAGQDDPVQVFHKLFSPDDMPLAQRQAAIAENRSVLDAVLTQA